MLALLCASVASANVGASTHGGTLAGEPEGIANIAIAHEELRIDLRPLATGGRAAVAATYHLDNRGDAQHLDLVFAAGANELGELRVVLDNRAITSHPVASASLPPTWRAPATTPLPDGGELGFGLTQQAGAAGFALDLAPGVHVLAITYTADAMLHHANAPVLLHQFAYVLAPARTWAGFGGLAVTLEVPPGWIAAVAPALARTGATLTGAFTSLPADAIAITVHAPLGAYGLIRTLAWIALVIVVLGGGIALYRIARAVDRRRVAAGLIGRPGLTALGLAMLWSTACLAAGVLVVFGPPTALPDGQADHRGYGDAFATLGVLALAGVLFLVGIALGLRAARRRT